MESKSVKKKSTVKKVGIGIGVVFGLFVLAAIIVPLVVDVDKYRPQIVEAVNQKINGKLGLGKLSLSLWGQVKVEVAGMNLTDTRGNKLLSVSDAYFHLPFLPLLTGSPVVDLRMNKPEVHIVTDANGKMNLMTLMKSEGTEATSSKASSAKATPAQAGKPASSTATQTTTAPTAGSGSATTQVALPAIATRARAGFEMRDATIAYKNVQTKLDSKIEDFNLVVQDISLSHPVTVKMWANVDTKMTGMTVKGPIALDLKAQPSFSGGKFEKATAQLKIDLDRLEIMMPGLFEKTSKMVANAEGEFLATATEAKIEKLDVKFFNADMTASADVTNTNTDPVVRFHLKSNPIDLKPWNQLVPMLKDYDLAGTLNLDASANGPVSKLGYGATLGLKGIRAKSPMLKAEPHIDGEIKVATDMIEKIYLTIKAPENDLKISGKMVSFTRPQISLDVTSSGMDLDKLINFPPPAKKSASLYELIENLAVAAEQGGATSDYDALLAPLRKNPMMAAMGLKLAVNMKVLKAYNMAMSNIVSQISMRDLTASIDHFAMNLWSGLLSAHLSANLKPATPTYQLSASGSNIQLQQGMESQMAMLKNTLIGTADFKLDAHGSSFNPTPATKNLSGKGNLKVTRAKFATIDVMKMAQGVNAQIAKVGEKVPFLRGKSLASIGNKEARYDSVTTDFTISDGRFVAPNFYAKSENSAGIDIKGNTSVGLVDYSIKANWELVDVGNVFKAKDLTVNISGTDVHHPLNEGNNPFRVPVTVGCTVMQPCYTYTEVPEFLGKVALGNTRQVAENKVKQMIGNQAPPALNNAIQGLGKKLFGR